MTKLGPEDLNWSLKRGVDGSAAATALGDVASGIYEFIREVDARRAAGTGASWMAVEDFSNAVQPRAVDLVSQTFLDPDVVNWLVQEESNIPDVENYLAYLKNKAARIALIQSKLSASALPGVPSQRGLSAVEPEKTDETRDRSDEPLALLRKSLHRFNVVAAQLGERHQNRPTLTIADEYDVQDLLHALLRLHFDDVRREEWTPSYAGKSSRVDFLLKPQRIVVEAKMTRPRLGAKELGDQLIIDIHRYAKIAKVEVLLCFVYDPGGLLKNPRGFEADLSAKHNELVVEVIVAPRQ